MLTSRGRLLVGALMIVFPVRDSSGTMRIGGVFAAFGSFGMACLSICFTPIAFEWSRVLRDVRSGHCHRKSPSWPAHQRRYIPPLPIRHLSAHHATRPERFPQRARPARGTGRAASPAPRRNPPGLPFVDPVGAWAPAPLLDGSPLQ